MSQKLKLSRGNEELISSGGNALCGHYLMHLADAHLPANFQLRRSDAISDCDILLTMTGMLCNARTDFANVRLYEVDPNVILRVKCTSSLRVKVHHFVDVKCPQNGTTRVNQSLAQERLESSSDRQRTGCQSSHGKA